MEINQNCRVRVEFNLRAVRQCQPLLATFGCLDQLRTVLHKIIRGDDTRNRDNAQHARNAHPSAPTRNVRILRLSHRLTECRQSISPAPRCVNSNESHAVSQGFSKPSVQLRLTFVSPIFLISPRSYPFGRPTLFRSCIEFRTDVPVIGSVHDVLPKSARSPYMMFARANPASRKWFITVLSLIPMRS